MRRVLSPVGLIVAAVLALLLAGGGFGYLAGHYFGDRAGHARGISECHTATLQSQLQAANQERDNLKAQLDHQNEAVRESDAQKQAIADDLAALQARAGRITFNPACRFPARAVELLNEAR